MFSHTKNYSLHRQLLEDRTEAFLAELKNFPAKKKQLDASHCTPLQLAAKKGNIEAILSLVREGVDINSAAAHQPPLYLAIKYAHYLAAHVLFYLGASKDKVIKLAHRANNILLANEIGGLALDIDIFRGVLAWIGKQEDENKKIKLMKQLKSKIKITPENSAFGEQIDDMYVILVSEEKEVIINTISENAIRQDLSAILGLAEAKNHAKLVSYLLKTYPRSFRADLRVAPVNYSRVLNGDQINYEYLLLEAKQRDVLLLHMFLSAQYSYEIIMKHVELQEEFFSLLKIPQEKQGLLYRFMMRGIEDFRDSRTDHEKRIQKTYFATLGVSREQWIKMYSEMTATNQQHLIQSKADRFEMRLHLTGKEQKSSSSQHVFDIRVLVKLMRTFLLPKESARLNSVACIFTHHHSSLLLLQIRDFLNALNEEIESKACFEGRCNRPMAKRMGIVVLLFCIALASYGTTELSMGADHIRDEMRFVNATSGVPCHDLLVEGVTCPVPTSELNGCLSLCSQLDGYYIGSILVGIFGIGGLFLSLLVLSNMIFQQSSAEKEQLRNSFRGRERFNHIPLSKLSAPVRASATNLFSKFEDDPEFDLFETSTVWEIQKTLLRYTGQLQTRMQGPTLFGKRPNSPLFVSEREALLEHKERPLFRA